MNFRNKSANFLGMSDYVFGKRTLGIVLQPTEAGSELFRKVASVAEALRRPFARQHTNRLLRNLVYVQGPDDEIKSLRDNIETHPGLREINYESVERKRR